MDNNNTNKTAARTAGSDYFLTRSDSTTEFAKLLLYQNSLISYVNGTGTAQNISNKLKGTSLALSLTSLHSSLSVAGAVALFVAIVADLIDDPSDTLSGQLADGYQALSSIVAHAQILGATAIKVTMTYATRTHEGKTFSFVSGDCYYPEYYVNGAWIS